MTVTYNLLTRSWNIIFLIAPVFTGRTYCMWVLPQQKVRVWLFRKCCLREYFESLHSVHTSIGHFLTQSQGHMVIWQWSKVSTYFPLFERPCGLTLSWWGRYGLRPGPKNTRACPLFLFCSCVCFCPYGLFNFILLHKFSRQLSAFSLCPSDLILPYWSFELYISFWKSPSALM